MIKEKLKIVYSLLLVGAITLTISCSEDGDPDVELTEALEVVAATAVTGTSFTANWQAVTGAKFYVLEVSENVEFTVPLAGYAAKQVTGTSHDVTGLSADKKYYYRVLQPLLVFFTNNVWWSNESL
ncbi:MAG: fibronectin type III domain-containing protein [Cyclobacteriaceae bacterium]|nr:fibronectin type III domain-containing protein [Cyclobacteriaceae bacterium]MBX2957216.1 fibronectin type III domain-containing protein [Cyclobacteriaceae bacterium]